jgi:hypothetical protein
MKTFVSSTLYWRKEVKRLLEVKGMRLIDKKIDRKDVQRLLLPLVNL